MPVWSAVGSRGARWWSVGASIALLATAASGDDWPQFRGPGGTGISAETGVVTALDGARHIAWKIDLEGRGLSSPVVLGDRVFLTCATGPEQSRLHVLCLDAATGRPLWERRFWATGRTMTQSKTCVAAPTIAAGAGRIHALFSSNDLFCLDADGGLFWVRGLTRDYANASNSLGLASSPVLVGDTLVVQVDNDSEPFAAGLDAGTGVNRWKIERPKGTSWSTPAVWAGGALGGGVPVVFQALEGLRAVDAASGRELWAYEAKGATIPSVAVDGATIFAACDGLTAFRAGGGAALAPSKLWEVSGLRPGTGSPLAWGGRVYSASGAGTVNCADAATGARLWQLRLKGPFSASPVAAGGHLYLVNEKGLLQVVEVGEKAGRLAGQLDLGDGKTFLATPAIAGGAIYIRTDAHLWKLAAR